MSSTLTLSDAELVEASGGYKRPADQLRELHRLGYFRARRSKVTGRVVLERGHYAVVKADHLVRPPVDYSTLIPRPTFHASSAKRAVALALRTPKWADLAAIEAIYAEAKRITASTGVPHHVDHSIPLQGRLVSGLHVANNLAVLHGHDNVRKSNRFEVE
jgi:hypothetical protein